MAPAGQRAQRVVIVAAAGARVEGGPARPIKLMASTYPTTGAPPIRVAIVAGRATVGGPALPVVQVASGGEGGDILPVTMT